ncbi:MAG: gamma-glutamyltransferase [Acidobacteriota bacterium]
MRILAVVLLSIAVATSQTNPESAWPQPGRSVVYGVHGMAATSQPLATAAALKILQQGGSAADAAIAAAAVLNVVEPHMTGIGGDMFALYYRADSRDLYGLNGSGHSPAAASIEKYRALQGSAADASGILAVTVPGAVDGWISLHERFGKKPWKELLQPAIEYAENGFPVTPIIAEQWASQVEKLKRNDAAAANYLVDGEAPRAGEIFFQKDLGKTLKLLAEGGREAFYRGAIAKKIVAESRRLGGLLTEEDFALHRSEWVQPVSTRFGTRTVFQMPPNSQGIATLEMLNIAAGFDLKKMRHNSADYLHTLIESKKIAFADRDHYLSDRNAVPKNVLELISPAYAARRRKEVNPKRAAVSYAPALPEQGDTVYLCVVDQERNAVSFINSLFSLFGSGIVVPETGICLHSRGNSFQLREGVSNSLGPRKSPMHTLIPGMVFEDQFPVLVYGVMGADMQPQGHVQVLLNLFTFGMDLQQAGEAPRARHSQAGVALEAGIPAAIGRALEMRGHKLVKQHDVWGGYQAISIDWRKGTLAGASDPRKDGCALGW